MEDGLGAKTHTIMEENNTSLNPCFSGGWSRRPLRGLYLEQLFFVLILVLVEDGLGVSRQAATEVFPKRLNPCFSGGWSRSLGQFTSEDAAREWS